MPIRQCDIAVQQPGRSKRETSRPQRARKSVSEEIDLSSKALRLQMETDTSACGRGIALPLSISESVVRKIAKQMEVATAKKTKKLKGLKTRRNWMSPLFSGD